MLIWAYLRHFINLRIIYSLFPYDLSLSLPTPLTSTLPSFIQHYTTKPLLQLPFPANEFATVGPYDLHWPSQQYKCWISQIITFCLLLVLQAVNIFWFFLICRILARYIRTSPLADERSDDEDEEELDLVEGSKSMPNGITGNGMGMNGKAKGPRIEVKVNGVPLSPKNEEFRDERSERKASLRKR